MDVHPSNPRRVTAALSALVLGGAVYAQQAAPKIPTEPELVGTLPYSTTNGPTQYIVVQVGDGGSGPYKSVLVGDPNLKTHTLYRVRATSKRSARISSCQSWHMETEPAATRRMK